VRLFSVGVVLGISMLVVTAPVSAQSSGDDAARVNVGFSSLRETSGGVDFWDRGFRAGIEKSLNSGPARLGVTGEFTWHRNSTFNDHLVGVFAGPQLIFQAGNVEPFAQFLLGMEICCSNPSEHAFSIQPGGGLTIWLGPFVGVRGQVDFRKARYTNSDTGRTSWYDEGIAGVSLVIRLGG